MLCGIENIPHNIPGYSPHPECGEYRGMFSGILSVPQNTVMDLNNAMKVMCSNILDKFHCG